MTRQALENAGSLFCFRCSLPLPEGEGWGEGEQTVRIPEGTALAIASLVSLSRRFPLDLRGRNAGSWPNQRTFGHGRGSHQTASRGSAG